MLPGDLLMMPSYSAPALPRPSGQTLSSDPPTSTSGPSSPLAPAPDSTGRLRKRRPPVTSTGTSAAGRNSLSTTIRPDAPLAASDELSRYPHRNDDARPPIDFSILVNGGIFGASVTFGVFAQVVIAADARSASSFVLDIELIAWAFASFTLSVMLSLFYGTFLTSPMIAEDARLNAYRYYRRFHKVLRFVIFASGYCAAAAIFAGIGILCLAMINYGAARSKPVKAAGIFAGIASMAVTGSAVQLFFWTLTVHFAIQFYHLRQKQRRWRG